MNASIVAAGFFGAIAGAWLGRALFKWVLDVEGPTLAACIVAFGVIGLVLAVAGERERAR